MAREKRLVKKETGELEHIEPWNTFTEMERMFRDFFTRPFSLMRPSRLWAVPYEGGFTPEVDLKETDKEFILSASVPGLDKDDIDVNITRDRITISGERKSEEDKSEGEYHIRQQSYGSFNVSYALPAEVKSEDATATYKNGILKVTMPKAQVSEAKKINIKVED